MNALVHKSLSDSERATVARRSSNAINSAALSTDNNSPAQHPLQESLNRRPSVQSQLQTQHSLDHSPRVITQTKLAQTLSERKSTLQPHQTLQRQEGLQEEELLQKKVDGPVQRKETETGLPDGLRTGIETLSGLPMQDVEVEYNSTEPAKVNALATTQGKQIKLGPGQEKHLPHEAWHAVQQKQGRVEATKQLRGVEINDDSGLEREADVMGARANQIGSSTLQRTDESGSGPLSFAGSCGHAACSSRSSAVQRKLTDISSDDVESPAAALKDALGVPVKNMLLPGTQPAGNVPRARSVEAVVDNKTLRKDERKKSANLTKITTMARAEQALLQGADVKKFYDAGHLVADQLIGKKDDSFVLWNLAPQVSSLNAPTYAQIMEEEIKLAAKGATVKVKVSVDYPDGGTYKVKIKEIVKRGIVESKPVDTDTVKIGSKNHKLDEEIDIPRRVPNQWKMKATVDHKKKEFPKIKKPAGKDELAEHFVPDITTAQQPTIGMPFRFTVSDSSLVDSQLKVKSAQKRVFKARQWGPSSAGVMTEDIISLVSSIFRDLESGKAILNKLKGSDVLVPQSQQDVIFSTIQEVSKPLTDLLSLSVELNKVSEERSGISNELTNLSLLALNIMSTADLPNQLKILTTTGKITNIQQLELSPVGDTIGKLNSRIEELKQDYGTKIKVHIEAAKKEPELTDAMKHIFNAHSAVDDVLEEIAPMKDELQKLQEVLKVLIEKTLAIKEELQKLQEEVELAKEQQQQSLLAPKIEEGSSKPFSFFTSDSVSFNFFQPAPQKAFGDTGGFTFGSEPPTLSSEETTDISSKKKRSRKTQEQEEEEERRGEKEHTREAREKRVHAPRSAIMEGDFREVPYSSEVGFGGGTIRFFWFGTPPVKESDHIILKGNEFVTVTNVRSEHGLVYVSYREGF